jgi:ribonuclease VapC
MMIDASAIIAILNDEADAPRFAAAIDAAKAPFTSPIAVYEATVALMQENQWTAEEAGGVVREFLDAASIKVVMISETIATSAAKAFEKFGEGRHPANLNLGDCFADAAARAYRAPLLFKGYDFSGTNVKTVKI